MLNLDQIRKHLTGKVDEWIREETQFTEGKPYRSLAEAEQAFKDWLWGTSQIGG